MHALDFLLIFYKLLFLTFRVYTLVSRIYPLKNFPLYYVALLLHFLHYGHKNNNQRNFFLFVIQILRFKLYLLNEEICSTSVLYDSDIYISSQSFVCILITLADNTNLADKQVSCHNLRSCNPCCPTLFIK